LARGQLAREEAEVQAASAASPEEVQANLREAIRALGALEQEIAQAIRQGHRARTRGQGELSVPQLHVLHENVQFQLARALENQARLFDQGSADQLNALGQSLERLDRLAQSATSDELRWQSRMERLTCVRLMRRFDDARQLIAQLQSDQPPAALVSRLEAEAVHLALAEHRLEEAHELTERFTPDYTQLSPQWDLARLETYIALWKDADHGGRDEDAETWQTRAVETIRTIEDRYGMYWQRRAESQLAAAASGASVRNLDVLVRAADRYYLVGQWDDAVANYTRAAQKAKEAGRAGEAFQLSLKAASIEHQRQHHQDALVQFRQTALAYPSHSQAAEAHLLAVLNASLLAQQGDGSSLGTYEDLLHEHLRSWPSGPTSDKAKWWLGRLREHRHEWSDALAAYRAVSVDFPQFEEVLEGTARSYRSWLAELAGLEQFQIADQAAGYFELLTRTPTADPQPSRSRIADQAAVLAAEMRLRYVHHGYLAAQNMLSSVAYRQADAEENPWAARAGLLLVVALAGQGKWSEAEDLLTRLGNVLPDDLLEMLELLSHVADHTEARHRAPLARLQGSVADKLMPHQETLAPPQRTLLVVTQADALARLGHEAKALELYRRLSAELANDGRVQEGYAALLLDQDERALVSEALEKWRNVLERSQPQSPQWFRAKYAVALAHYKLGNKEQAAKIIELTRTLHPDLGGPDRQKEFLELLQMCSSQ
jgi:tetratricopeptide (TPR) repeat protein